MDSFEQTLRAAPGDAAARSGERDTAIAAALQARAGGNEEQALSLLLRARRWLGDDAVVLLDTGVLEEQMKLYKDADAALEQARRSDPQNPKVLYAQARVKMDLGQTSASADAWVAYLALRPRDASAHYGYGLLLQEAGQTDRADAEFQQSVALQPAQIESYYRLGEIRREAGQASKAADFYQKALDRNPKHPGALTGLGILAFQARQYDTAEQDLSQAVSYAPEFQTAHYYYGLVLRKQGETEKAAAELKLAAALADQQNRQNASRGRELASAP